jgi:Na+/melibiose symporter-like transporter
MKKFFQSGGAFIVVALLCVVAGLISRDGSAFTIIAAVWLILAIIMRAKNAKKPPGDKSSSPGGA